MPPKGGNAKKESGRAKKAENEAKKKAAADAVKVQCTSCSLTSQTFFFDLLFQCNFLFVLSFSSLLLLRQILSTSRYALYHSLLHQP